MFEQYVQSMKAARNAAERKTVIDEMCRLCGFKAQKAYNILKEHGWESGRKKRVDAGKSAVSAADLEIAGALIKNGLRKNGKSTMPVTVARSVLSQNGLHVDVSNSRLRQLLKEASMTVQDVKTASPYQKQRTEYPNQVHMADPSVSLLYFAPRGLQRIVRDDEQYKNKNFLEGKAKCWRYVLTDHYSSSICVRYYSAMGETALNMYDFLLYAWGQKQNPLYAFHGLPELLVWDCGSANISSAVTKALAALRVETKPHLPGNPRAKGQVECANNIVETHFECLLKLEPVHSLEELNDAAERWCAAYNANMIDSLDCTLYRAGQKIGSRLSLWQRIADEQLRELPDAEICRQIFTGGLQVRKVAGDLTIGITHPKTKRPMRYSLSHLPGILIGMEVNVQPVLVDAEALAKISYEYAGELISVEVKPVEYDDAGFDLASPVIGKEYKSKPDTLRETNVKRLAGLAGSSRDPVPFASITDGQGLKAHSLISAENPFASQRTGRQIEANTVEVHEISITLFECAKRVKARVGFLPDGFIAGLKEQFPDGVIASSLVDDLAQDILSGKSAITRGVNYA